LSHSLKDGGISSSPEEKLVAFTSLVVISLIWLLYKVVVGIILLFVLRSKNYIQYITSLPRENTTEADGCENDAGVSVLGQRRGTGVTPNEALCIV
jgi:hypothetical protein